jgi:SH3-like domain-containing protein
MGIMKAVIATPIVSLLLLSSCASADTEEILDQATVVADRASVRLRNSSTSRTIQVLDVGDKVDVLERDGNWFRIRYDGGIQGWMEESTVVTNRTRERIKEMAAASQNLLPQNTATLRDIANFRLEPGRSTPVIRRLEEGTQVEVLERVTTPREGSNDAYDVWLKVRPSPTEVGWVYSGLLEFDIPGDIAQYNEGYTYPAVQVLNRVQDPIAGTINWYIVAERKSGIDPQLDFDGIRVFTWNLRRHRYETAFRATGLRGIYPLEVSSENGAPAFTVHELSGDGVKTIQREFVMQGVVVREKKG